MKAKNNYLNTLSAQQEKPLLPTLATLVLCCALFLPALAMASPYGMALRPFPAIMGLDYAPGRAAAWLDALGDAAQTLPASVDPRLRAIDFDVSISKLGLCAAIFSVEIATPAISPSREIRVYLAKPVAMRQKIEQMLAEPALLSLHTILVIETSLALKHVLEAWPRHIASAIDKIPRLEALCRQLDSLWTISSYIAGNTEQAWAAQVKNLEKMAATAPESSLAQFLLARACVNAGLPQAAVYAADRCLRMEKHPDAAAEKYSGIWNFFYAYVRYERAQAHWRLKQPALASADLEAAKNLIRLDGIKSPLLASILIAQGEIWRLRRNMEAMCNAFQQACATGECQPLADARRQGFCVSAE